MALNLATLQIFWYEILQNVTYKMLFNINNTIKSRLTYNYVLIL